MNLCESLMGMGERWKRDKKMCLYHVREILL